MNLTKGLDLVCDANSIFARSYYAANSPDSDLRHDPDGYLIAAFKNFFTLLRTTGLPERILFCFDGKSKTIKPRPPKPPDWLEKLDRFQEVIIDGFGESAHVLHPDHEGDDTVATVTCRAADQGREVIIVSGDKDTQQLHGSNVGYYCLNRKRLMTRAEICARWKIHEPLHVAVALAIIGDKMDGINGVDKMAEKAVERIFKRIPPTTPFDQLIEKVAEEMSMKQRGQFFESLDYTLLQLDVQTDARPVPFAPRAQLHTSGRAGDEWQRGVMMLDPEAALKAVDDWNP